MPVEPAHDTRKLGVPIALIAVSVAARLVSLAGLHPLNWDEIEFFRTTDWVRRGLVPYRDFWEHHTPLQWFLFAPVAAFIHSPGASAIIAMRWAQLPLWIATFWLINVWMRDAGIAAWPRWCAIALPLTSTLFMLPAVEYRVDVLAGALMILGIVFVQRIPRATWYAAAAGAAFCLSGFANLRLGPVLVLAMLLAQVMTAETTRWGGNPRSRWMFAGATGAFAVCALYFVATRSVSIAVRRLWTDNYLAEKWVALLTPHPFLHRIAVPFGYRSDRTPPFSASTIDPGGILLTLAVILVIVEMVRRRRAPDAVFYLGFVQLSNILFIAAMKFIYNYHFLSVAILMVPFVALQIERMQLPRSVVAILLLTTTVNAAAAVFRGKERDTAYQNLIMQQADALTPRNGRVFDSSGWALHREPAYRYWLLRLIAFVLVEHRVYEPYTPADMAASPPAAMVADFSVRAWFRTHPDLGAFAVGHYLPVWRDLWLPGLSARLSPQRPAMTWIVPADGTYRVLASARLATHPWFRSPLDWSLPMWRDASVAMADSVNVPLTFSSPVNGDRLVLRKGMLLTVTSTSAQPAGVFITPVDPGLLFRQPAPEVTLEGSADPEWHVPDLGRLP